MGYVSGMASVTRTTSDDRLDSPDRDVLVALGVTLALVLALVAAFALAGVSVPL